MLGLRGGHANTAFPAEREARADLVLHESESDVPTLCLYAPLPLGDGVE